MTAVHQGDGPFPPRRLASQRAENPLPSFFMVLRPSRAIGAPVLRGAAAPHRSSLPLRLVRLSGLTCLALSAGCNVIAGLDDLKYEGGAAQTGGGDQTGSGGDSHVGGGGSGTGGGAMGGGGEGGATGSEDCLNGTDDNGDGEIDCGDANCQSSHACVEVPDGWVGPFVLQEGAPSGAAPCAAPFENEVYSGVSGFVGPASECSPCACDPPPVMCELQTLQLYASNSCGGGQKQVTPSEGMCDTEGFDSIKGQPTTATVGSCAVLGGVQMGKDPSWNGGGRVCALPALGAGCTSTAVCAPSNSGALCVSQDGDAECPTAFPNKHLYFDNPEDVKDTRACSACTCVNPTGVCETITAVYEDNNCVTKQADLAHNGTCVFANGSGSYKPTTTVKDAGCTAQGGAPQGAVTPTDSALRTTVCCN